MRADTMAGVLRVSRPLLLASTQPRTASSPAFFGLCRAFSTTTLRPYASKGRAFRQSRASQPRQSKRDEAMQMQANMTVLLPGTLVAPPLWRYPRRPSQFAHMLWLNAKNRLQNLWAVLSIKILSQPTMIFSRPRFKFHKAAAIPTAKALHVQMSEALAAGDKETLRSICTPELFQTLAATIDSRPPGVRAEWELVRYNKPWRFPRIADWRIGYQPLHDGSMRIIKQVVVSIASVQRMARYDDSRGGIKIAGSDRVGDMVQHFVIQAVVDKATHESQPWKIWGTLPEMNYETYLADVENLQAMMSEEVGKA
ncbi:hypothetical protein F5Y05DRAFT_375902 [Hypoxylon sp. FL0543]|nr:hypothetical protein F5Y05DRAFT_375902 [Hypoxylon sp. FL0543]